jgi:hypothetical protein
LTTEALPRVVEGSSASGSSRRVGGYKHPVRLDRGDPRRVLLVAALVGAAAIWGYRQADDDDDALRFIAGIGMGLTVAGLMRWADGTLARHAGRGIRSRLSGLALILGPLVGVLAAGVLARTSGPGANVEVFMAGTFAAFIATVGVLYPIE